MYGVPSMTTLGSTVYDNLFAGSVSDIVTDVRNLEAGQVVTRGTVLGEITATGCMCIVNSANTDGSNKLYAIAADGVDATLGIQPVPIYITGEFNKNALVFGGTDTSATHLDYAKQIGIYFKSNVTVGGTY